MQRVLLADESILVSEEQVFPFPAHHVAGKCIERWQARRKGERVLLIPNKGPSGYIFGHLIAISLALLTDIHKLTREIL
jgi:hypothetical protein